MATPVWLPGVLIGGGALAVIYFLSKQGGGRPPIVSNALLPTATPVQAPSRDPARVAAFEVLGNVALGTQRLAEQSQSIAAQLDLGRFRLQEQTALAGASLEATRAGQQSAIEMARIREEGQTNRLREQLIDRNYDRELQARALDQTYALAQQGQIGQGIGQLLAGILAAMRPQGRAGGGASGGAGGGAGAPIPRGSPRPRYPSIPMPNLGGNVFTPPFFPDWPGVDYPGFPDLYYEPPGYVDLPFGSLPNPLDFPLGPGPGIPYTPESDYPILTPIPGTGGGGWWDWGYGDVGGYPDYYDGGGYGGGGGFGGWDFLDAYDYTALESYAS